MDIEALYLQFNEDERLNQCNSGRIEFETTMWMLKKHLKPNMKILELGAGTGIYTLALANLGYVVTAVELLEHHLNILKSKVKNHRNATVIKGDAQELNFLEKEQFDMVLCFGPLYHLNRNGQRKCLNHIHRVLKKDGIVFNAYLNHNAIFTTETMVYNQQFLESDLYNHDTMKLRDEPFVFFSIEYMTQLLKDANFIEINQFAQDGIGELCAKRINQMNELQFQKWMDFHLLTCENKEMWGYSNHMVSIARKGESV